jgi:hypothetical protein
MYYRVVNPILFLAKEETSQVTGTKKMALFVPQITGVSAKIATVDGFAL